MQHKRALVILNPNSGQHSAETSIEEISQSLTEAQIKFEIKQTQSAQDAPAWSKAAKEEGFDLVVAAGGDGTILEVVNGLLKAKSDLPLVVVPLGTGNGLARLLNLPLSIKGALQAGLEGSPVKLDVGYLIHKDLYFLLFAGAGYDADVIKAADREQKNKLGLAAYILELFRQLPKRRNQRLRLELDGAARTFYAHSITVFNASEFTISGLALGPNVDPQDGLLDIVIMNDPSVWGMFKKLLQLSFAQLTAQEIRLKAKHIKVLPQHPLNTHADGEPLGKTPLDIKLVPAALSVYAAAHFFEKSAKAA